MELTNEDILCELKLLAQTICNTDNLEKAEKAAKKIVWLMELWEDYKKMIDAQELLNRLNKLRDETYADIKYENSLRVRNHEKQLFLLARIETIKKIQTIVKEMEEEK